jgi:glutathione S-transferase
MTLKLYAHPLSSYCWKVLIPLYEHDIPFTFRQLDIDNAEVGTEFAAVSPMGRIPVLVDDGRAIIESSVIVEYLDLRHRGDARLIPVDAEAALTVRMLDRAFDNYVMTPMGQIVFDRIRPAENRDPYGVEQARALLEKAYGWLDGELSGRTWAAGEDFSLADCAAAPSLHYADKVRPLRDGYPTLGAYLDRLEARPSFARVLAEAAPYAHMFPEESA